MSGLPKRRERFGILVFMIDWVLFGLKIPDEDFSSSNTVLKKVELLDLSLRFSILYASTPIGDPSRKPLELDLLP
jgi:hypothetical protein